jgi:dipeptidyl aminopeptidase/acylaminoacyl peptidase
MHKIHFALRLVMLTLVILLIAACGASPTPVAEPTNPPPTNTPEPEPTAETEVQVATAADTVAQEPTAEPTLEPTIAPTAEPVAADGSNGLILAWVAPAAAPGRQRSDAAGELVYFAPDGTMETLMALPGGTTRVTACGDASTSPDGSIFAFMTTVTGGGGESANLHLIRGVSTEIVTVAEDLNPIACVGSSPFHFSPDGSRFGFIDWADSANNAVSPIGRLLIYETDSAEQVANIENVTDFTLTDAGAVFASFFLNNDDEATEVGIFTWDGSNDSEISTLRAEENCTYTSASVVPTGDESLAAILGYRCDGGATQWQLHTVDTANNTAQLELSEATGGRYFGFSDTNATWLSPDGETLWFTVPDGVSNQTVSLLSTAIDSISPTTVIDRFAFMPTVSDLPYDANNATARFSPNGQYLAIVRNDGSNNAVLHIVNLDEPSLAPVQVDAGDNGDTIATLAFSQDNSQLILVAGTDEGGNNALVQIDLATGNESRIARGRYSQAVIAPDASRIAAMSWVVYDEDEEPYLSLVVVDAASGEETVIFEGGTVDGEGNLTNQAFAYPLSWRTPVSQ